MKMCTEIKKNKIKKISVHTVSAENYNCFSLYKSLRLLGYSKMKLFDQASDIFFRIFKLVCNLGKSFSFLEFFLNEIASFPFFALPNTFFESFVLSVFPGVTAFQPDMFFFVIFVNAHVFHLRSIFLKK